MLVKPFVKWAGGKGQLLPSIQKKYPSELGKSINKYCEPFVGGGAVLFDILSKYNIEEVLINDINFELINAYVQIKNNIDELIAEIEKIHFHYISLDTEQQKTYYYEQRAKFKGLLVSENQQATIERASLFIFLNKTCFNGLYRVNRKGEFNVPIGSYKNPSIYCKKNLRNLSKLLQSVTIICGDYRRCVTFIDSKTFVYIDPPYRQLTKTSSFTSYDPTFFDDAQQIALCEFVDKISVTDAKVIISNSDPKNIDELDLFFDNLYAKYKIDRVFAKRMINSNGKSRGFITELLISNY